MQAFWGFLAFLGVGLGSFALCMTISIMGGFGNDLKHKILGTGSKSVDGVYLPPTTTKLDVTEFSDYIEKCARWLAEFTGIYVVPSDLFYQGATQPKTNAQRDNQAKG